MFNGRSRFWQLALILAAIGYAGSWPVVLGQPTYKLDVKPHLKPLATLKLDGTKITRTDLQDDPGFRLQYHFQKDGKTVATVEARSAASLDLPQKEAGIYTVVLELFYPAYKGGNQQKGGFRPVSNVLRYRVEAGDPVKVTLVESPEPTKK
jgi:hypothetical protein